MFVLNDRPRPGAGQALALVLALVLAALVSVPALAEEETGAPVYPDEILLKSGSKILGKITGTRDGQITMETDFAGTISISLDLVASARSAEPVVIQLADESVLPEQPLVIQDEQLVAATVSSPAESRDLEDLLLVNPEPWELGRGYKWTGLASLAMVAQRGNTETDELDYNLESLWRSKVDRYSLRYNGENDKNDGVRTVKKWYAQAKYDYFFSGPIYGGIQTSAEHDKFTDLDLRWVIGPVIGRQFYEEPILTLAAEVGTSYVDENFFVAEDQDYMAANWAVNASSNYLGGDSRLYLNHRGIISMDDSSDYILDTTFGLAFPLLWNFEAATEVLLEYDAGAVEGVDKLDQTYRFRVGYIW
jgi:hypothetical protein